MSENSGITLDEYQAQIFEEGLRFEMDLSGYPEHNIVLSKREIELVRSIRKDDSDISALTEEESEYVLKSRIDLKESFLQLKSDIASARQEIDARGLVGKCFVLPYARHLILVRKPTMQEFQTLKIDKAEVEKTPGTPRDTAIKIINIHNMFARKMLVYPMSPPDEKLDILDDIFNLSIMLASDDSRAISLKLVG
jgi:hypothetical protein